MLLRGVAISNETAASGKKALLAVTDIGVFLMVLEEINSYNRCRR